MSSFLLHRHRIPLPDGRVLAADEHGVADGRPVLFLPAAPGSRRFDPDPAVTRQAGVRLLVTDRPGYGDSTPHPPGTVPTWGGVADDHAVLVAGLGLGPVDVVGWSNGGLGALALAARHPGLVATVTIAGTPAPDDEVPWIPGEFRDLLHALRRDPGTAVATLAPAFQPLVDAPGAALSGIAAGHADDSVLADPEARSRLLAMLAEAMRPGAGGVAADVTATNVAPPGFDPADVATPVRLLYGADDVLVPPAHGQYHRSRLTASTLEVLPGVGHLAVMARWDRMLGGG